MRDRRHRVADISIRFHAGCASRLPCPRRGRALRLSHSPIACPRGKTASSSSIHSEARIRRILSTIARTA